MHRRSKDLGSHRDNQRLSFPRFQLLNPRVVRRFFEGIGTIGKLAAAQPPVDRRALKAREIAAQRAQESRQVPLNELERSGGIQVDPAQDFGVDPAALPNPKRSTGDRRIPFGQAFLEPEVRVVQK
jgi:hypothetical protein